MQYIDIKFGILYSYILIFLVLDVVAQYRPDAPPNNNIQQQSPRITRSVLPSLENTFANTNIGSLDSNNLQPTFTNSASTSVFTIPISNGFATNQGSTTANLATKTSKSAVVDVSPSSPISISSSVNRHPSNDDSQKVSPRIPPRPSSSISSYFNRLISNYGDVINAVYSSPSTSISKFLNKLPLNYGDQNVVPSSPSTSISSFLNKIPSNYGDLNVFAKAVLSNPALRNYLNVAIPGNEASTILFDIADGILQDLGHPNSSNLATLVGQEAAKYELFTIPSYFQAVGNTIEKFLRLEGVHVVPSIAENYADIIARSISAATISDSRSLCKSILNGFVAFIQSLGFNFLDKSELLSQVFNKEVAALQ